MYTLYTVLQRSIHPTLFSKRGMAICEGRPLSRISFDERVSLPLSSTGITWWTIRQDVANTAGVQDIIWYSNEGQTVDSVAFLAFI